MPLARMLLINIGHGLDHLLMLLFPVVAALAASSFNESYATLLVLTTGSWLAFGLGALPAGWLADRWSRHGMLTVYFIGSGVACLLTALAQNYWQIAGALFLLGAFASIYHPVGVAILAGGSASSLGRRLAINGVWGNIGVAMSALTAGALADLLGWRAAFVIPGIVTIAVGLAWWFLVPASEVDHAQQDTRAPESAPLRWKQVVVIIAALTVLTGFIFQATIVSVPKLFDERLDALAGSATVVGFLAFGVYLLAGVAQLVVGGLIDRFAIKPIFLIVVALQAGALFLVAGAEGPFLIAAAAAMMALVYAELPIADTLIGRYAPARLRSRIYAVIYLITFGASTAAIPAIAFIHDNSGFLALYVLLTAMAAAVFAAVTLLPGRMYPGRLLPQPDPG